MHIVFRGNGSGGNVEYSSEWVRSLQSRGGVAELMGAKSREKTTGNDTGQGIGHPDPESGC